MRTVLYGLALSIFFSAFLVSESYGQSAGWQQPFWTNFRSAVSKNDKAAVKNMIGSTFEWAYDGAGSREEGWRSINSERSYWLDLRKAVQRKPYSCKAIWENYPGYCVNSGPRARYDWMFAKVGGTWRFYALRGH